MGLFQILILLIVINGYLVGTAICKENIAPPVLRGTVLLYSNESNEWRAADRYKIMVEGYGHLGKTYSNGSFKLTIPHEYDQDSQKVRPLFLPGEKLPVQVKRKGYVVYRPFKGIVPIPQDGESQPVKIKLLPKGHSALLDDEQMIGLIQQLQDQVPEKVNPQGSSDPVELGPLLKKWAWDFGFSVEEVQERIDAWVAKVLVKRGNVGTAEALYWKRKFKEARIQYHQTAQFFHRQNEREKSNVKIMSKKAAAAYKGAGDSAYADFDFEGALEDYKRARAEILKELQPRFWAEISQDISKAYWAIGTRTKGPAIRQKLALAEKQIEEAINIFAKYDDQVNLAKARGSLAVVLLARANREMGKDSTHYLERAVAMQRSNLEIVTQNEYPEEWAKIQFNLGILRASQARRIGGEKRENLLNKAESRIKEALRIRTKERNQEKWAETMGQLASVLAFKARTLALDEDFPLILGEAETTYRKVLSAWSYESNPENFVKIRLSLNEVLLMKDSRDSLETKEGLIQARNAYQKMLEKVTPASNYQYWASLQTRFGEIATRLQLYLQDKSERARLLKEAIKSFDAALTIQTLVDLPVGFAGVQYHKAQSDLPLEYRTPS